MAYFVYIISSESTTKWYYGHSEKPLQRLEQHNSGKTKSIKGRGPWKLIFLREFATKKEAVNFEFKLKKLRNKEYIRKAYSAFFISGCGAAR